MSLPAEVASSVEEALSNITSKSIVVKNFSPSSGGCINNGGRIITTSGDFFLKYNKTNNLPGLFDTESRGLELLRKTGTISIPRVLHDGKAGIYQYIVLEFIDGSRRSNLYWEQAGEHLAKLHQSGAKHFGLDHNNYIGSLSQMNGTYSSWVEFYVERRIHYQAKLAIDTGLLHPEADNLFEALYKKLPDLLPSEHPSLLHGDLWNGNLIIGWNGEPVFIDPAVYYGNREMDLAMTRLFGGFDNAFYRIYNETFPLAKGYEKRVDLYQLYPLLVHVNLFGGSYVSSVLNIVKKYVN